MACLTGLVFAGEVKKALTQEEVAGLFTSDVITKHYDHGKKSAGERKVEVRGGDIYVSFTAVKVQVGLGGTFFTAEDAEAAQEGFLASFLGESLSPKIGLRAHIYGIEDDILVFTTSDGKYDIRIEPSALTPTMDVVGIGREVSKAYDQRTQSPGNQ